MFGAVGDYPRTQSEFETWFSTEEACRTYLVRLPGMGHLEDPTLTSDLTVARDFDLGMTGPPL